MQSPTTAHWSYVNILDIPHYDALYARKYDALMRAMSDSSPHGGTDDDECARLYTFLSGIPEDTLQPVARKFAVPSDGTKTKLVYGIFLFLREVKKNGGNVYTKLIANEYCPLFDDFLEHVNRTGQVMEVPPDEQEMHALVGEAQDAERDDPYVPKVDPHTERECVGQDFFDKSRRVDSAPLSLSEFARLMIVLCKDAVASPALQKLAMDTSIDQTNQEKYRDKFWRLAARRYNDQRLSVSFPFTGGVAAAGSCAERDWRALKAHFEVTLGRFMTYFGNWNRVAREETDRFERMLYKRGGEFCTCSRRALVMFQAGMRGDHSEDIRMLTRWTKAVFYSLQAGIPVSHCIDDY